MNVKLLLIFLAVSAEAFANDDKCRWIYRCCEKVDDACIRVCEPEIVCDIEESTPQASVEQAAFFSVIEADCKTGFRHNSRGKCRKVL